MSSKVFDELSCPDCGGRIGSNVPMGMHACTCFQEMPVRQRPLPDEPDPVDMVPFAPGVGADGKKRCRVCQKDLTGRSRLKDSKGYMCKKCSDDEFAADAERERDAIKCPECNRKLKPAAFVEWRGTLICRRCQADHVENDKLKVAQLGELKAHAEHDKRGLITLSIIAGAVLVLGIISKFVFSW